MEYLRELLKDKKLIQTNGDLFKAISHSEKMTFGKEKVIPN